MKSTTALLALLAAQTTLAAPVTTVSKPRKRLDVDKLLAAVLSSFPIGSAVKDLQSTLTSTQQDIADRLDVDTTRNASAGCADVTILFARGTDDPGNVGLLTGSPFFDAIQAQLEGKSLAVQGTNNYAASIDGFLNGGDKTGSQQLANDITSTLTKCPKTKLVVSGYSQGAQLVHNAADILGTKGMAGVSSVVVFGDPLDGIAVTGAAKNTKVICHFGDNICDGGDLILLPHLTYATDADDAADFVIEQAGL